jgi:hypothetical protein
MLEKQMMLTDNFKYHFSYFFIILFSLVQAQNTATGRIIDEKTNAPVTGVAIFINDRNIPYTTTSSASFSIQSDTIIYKLKFQKKIML